MNSNKEINVIIIIAMIIAPLLVFYVPWVTTALKIFGVFIITGVFLVSINEGIKKKLKTKNQELSDFKTTTAPVKSKASRELRAAAVRDYGLVQYEPTLTTLAVIDRTKKEGGGTVIAFTVGSETHRMILDNNEKKHLVKLLSVPSEPLSLE